MSGKPSAQTEKAIEWLVAEAYPARTAAQASKKFNVSRLSILVQLGQEYLSKEYIKKRR